MVVSAHARCSACQEDHADDWLQDVLDGFGEDDYVIFDCPGQVTTRRPQTPARPRAAPAVFVLRTSADSRWPWVTPD